MGTDAALFHHMSHFRRPRDRGRALRSGVALCTSNSMAAADLGPRVARAARAMHKCLWRAGSKGGLTVVRPGQ